MGRQSQSGSPTSRPGISQQLFTVLAAHRYPATGGKGSGWKLSASPTNQNTDSASFLALVPGRPLSVVCDRTLLHQSLQSLAEWDAFVTAVRAEPGWVSADKWVKHWDKRMRLQAARRASLPPVWPMVPWKHPSNAFVRCWSGDAGHSATVNE